MVYQRHGTTAAALQRLSHPVSPKAALGFSSLGAIEFRDFLTAVRCADRVLLMKESSVLWIIHDKSFAAEYILEQLPLRRANTAHVHSLTQYQALGDD